MAFPGPYAQVYYNEAGEPLGWDNNYPSEPEYDDAGDYERKYGHLDALWEEAYEFAQTRDDDPDAFAEFRMQQPRGTTMEQAWEKWEEEDVRDG